MDGNVRKLNKMKRIENERVSNEGGGHSMENVRMAVAVVLAAVAVAMAVAVRLTGHVKHFWHYGHFGFP